MSSQPALDNDNIPESMAGNISLITWINDHLLDSLGRVNSQARNISWWEKRSYDSSLYNSIMDQTSFLVINPSFAERIYCIRHNILSLPICPICSSPVKFICCENKYSLHCSHKCSVSDQHTIDKSRATLLKHYGVDNYSKTKKFKNTHCIHIISNKPHIKAKILETNRRLYGADYFIASDGYKQKMLDRHNRSNTNQLHISDYAWEKLNDKNWLIQQHSVLHRSQREISIELGVWDSLVSKYFIKHGITTEYFFRSIPEKELEDHLKLVCPGIEIVLNARNLIPPYEIDLYLPEYKLAIEYNGVFYHSFDRLESAEERSKHTIKYKLCKDAGIQLLQIFEGENLGIWKSIIEAKLGLKKKIWARRCKIIQIKNSALVKSFLTENHIQGYVASQIQIGLFCGEDMVALGTFLKLKDDVWEFNRFCNRTDCVVVGGASRILSKFIKTYSPKRIITYADLRYSTGDVYKKLGFAESHQVLPRYQYLLSGKTKLLSRRRCQKKRLAKLLAKYDPNMTEAENMFNNGYRRIWDCGKICFTMSF